MRPLAEEIRRQLEESCHVKQSFSAELVSRIAQFAEKAAGALRAGGKIIFFGNGGSAADAQHLSAELVVRLREDRRGLAARALSANVLGFAGPGDGYGLGESFSGAGEGRARAKDVVVAL